MFKKVITLFLFFFTQSVMADNLGIKSKMDIEEQEYNQKEFVRACQHSDLDRVKEFLAKGASAEVIVGNLHYGDRMLIVDLLSSARSEAEEDVTTYLIEQGVNISHVRDDGSVDNTSSLLHVAAKQNLLESTKALLVRKIDKTKKNKTGQNALFYARSLPMLNLLLDNDVGDLSSIDNEGNSLLTHQGENIINKYHPSEYSDELTEYLIKNIDVNVQNSEGDSALMFALRRDFHEGDNSVIINLLLDQSSDVNLMNNEGSSPLLLGIQNKHVKIEDIERIIKSGADLSVRDDSGFQAIHQAIRKNHQLFLLLAKQGADITAVTEPKKYSTLFLAATLDDIETVKYLIDKGIDINQLSFIGETALNSAINRLQEGSPIIKLLKEKGGVASTKADLERIAQENEKKAADEAENKLSALDRLKREIKGNNLPKIKQHYIEVINDPSLTVGGYNIAANIIRYSELEALLFAEENGLDIAAKDNVGYTLLHYAVYYNKLDVARRLIDKGLDVNAKSTEGYTVYSMTSNSSVEMVKLLLNENITVDESDQVNMAAQALHNKKPKLAAYFVEQGHKFPQDMLNDGDYLLEVLQAEDTDSLQYLLTNGLDIEFRVSVYGQMITLLHAAIILDSEKLALFILDGGGKPNARDLSGKPIYRSMIPHGTQSIIIAFYDNGGNVNDIIGEGVSRKSPLAEALEYGRVDVATLLVNKGADINEVDFLHKNSAIHEAARLGSVTLLKSIISHGGNVHQLNEARHAPLDIAVRFGKKEAEEYLLEMEAKAPAKK